MAQRGRKSAAAMAVVSPITAHRPPPPEGLTPEQADEWTAVTKRLPHDFFPRECHRLLEAYVRHCASFKLLSRWVDTFQEDWLAGDDGLKRYADLLALRDREGRALSALATRLRITPQSRYRAETAATAAAKSSDGREQWERVA